MKVKDLIKILSACGSDEEVFLSIGRGDTSDVERRQCSVLELAYGDCLENLAVNGVEVYETDKNKFSPNISIETFNYDQKDANDVMNVFEKHFDREGFEKDIEALNL